MRERGWGGVRVRGEEGVIMIVNTFFLGRDFFGIFGYL